MWLRILGAAVVVLVALRYAQYDDVKHPLTEKLNASYDYIIVGAGSAGCVLANRLSADSDVTVLLIEAGGDDRERDDISVPAAAPSLHHSDVDWDYVTVPQDGMEGFKEKRIYCSAGRVLGGSSSINYMLYVRGHRLDYDQWAAQGCEGWSYNEVLPYFIMSENMQDVEHVDADYHGKEGPLRVEVVNGGIPLSEVLVNAAAEMGLGVVDNNGGDGEGISYAQQTAVQGQRSSTSRAFLHPVLTRPNLHVVVNTFVTKVLFEKDVAVGLEMVRRSQKEVVRAKREVILSAGAFGSSKLLLLSGVGPKQHLRDLDIPLVADLPVGENLQDHLFFDYQVTLNQPISLTDNDRSSVWTALQLKLFGRGPLANVGVDVQFFVSTSASSQQQKWPDIQILTLSAVWRSPIMATFGYTQQVLKDVSRRDNVTHGFVCLPVLLRPQSRGTVRLNTSDPFHGPLIDPRYLTHPDDLDTLLRGVSFCQKLIHTRSLQGVGAEPTDVTSSACSAGGKYNTSDAEYWRCMVKRNARTVYHYSGTCKMGAPSDPSAVVDHTLRVHGLKGIRVVDASVFPTIPSGNTNAAVIMVAEKAADLIRQLRHKGQN
ncbi:L-sorbose 1-dehydrogenase-like [Littorina saxatilis]|uniref:Glucose-methanol-choline oxidoreductase N-terminal domain-containing protein n=1 Tax=Littorina saxatilis TaxID=31220 RepID=A0AAN9G0I0_9CAEN